MTSTAEALATGPFHGFFSEEATLYRLDPPVVAGGLTKKGIQTREVSHIIISALPEDEWGNGPETAVFAADERAVVDTDFYLRFGTVLEFAGNDPEAALARLGYAA